MEQDLGRRWELHPDVALRPERFGALAYHHGTRRLTFLRSPLLADLVRALPEHPSADAAIDALVPEARRGAHRRALVELAASGFLRPTGPAQP